MDYTMDDAKRMLRRVAEIMRAGLAEDATDEDKAKMQMLVSNDYREVNAMIESLLAPEQCHHQFSDSFEKKIQSLLLSYSFYTQTDDETKRL